MKGNLLKKKLFSCSQTKSFDYPVFCVVQNKLNIGFYILAPSSRIEIQNVVKLDIITSVLVLKQMHCLSHVLKQNLYFDILKFSEQKMTKATVLKSSLL